MKILLTVAITALFALTAMGGSFAGQDPPSNLLVVRGAYEWAWASPCDGLGMPGGCDPPPPLGMHHGFVIATEADWLRDFSSLADVISAFTIPGAGARCAAPYFDSPYDHCDLADLQNGYVLNLPPNWGQQVHPNWETFVVRTAGIPEPSTWALVAIGLGALALRRKR